MCCFLHLQRHWLHKQRAIEVNHKLTSFQWFQYFQSSYWAFCLFEILLISCYASFQRTRLLNSPRQKNIRILSSPAKYHFWEIYPGSRCSNLDFPGVHLDGFQFPSGFLCLGLVDPQDFFPRIYEFKIGYSYPFCVRRNAVLKKISNVVGARRERYKACSE